MSGPDLALASREPSYALRAVPQSRVRETLVRFWRFRNIMVAVSDAAIIMASVLVCYRLRFFVDSFSLQKTGIPDITLYVKSAIILSGGWLYGLWQEGEYDHGLRGVSAPTVRLRVILASGLYAIAALMVLGFMYREFLLSRQVYLMSAALVPFTMVGVRALFTVLDRYVAQLGCTSQLVIVGLNRTAYEFAEAVQSGGRATRIVGFVANNEPITRADVGMVPVVGDLRDLKSIHTRLRFDTLVLACPALAANAVRGDNGTIFEVLNFCEENDISLYMVPASFDVAVSPREVASFSGAPLISLRDASLHPLYAFVKRVIDITIAISVFLIGLPFWLMVVALIKLTSPGPLLFTQWRAGRHGRPFKMYKFRSMTVDAEAQLASLVDVNTLTEPVFKIRNDPRVTPIGKWLRRTGVDEIPQLLNVLKGDMSIIGPRPEEMRLVTRYDPWQRRRLKAKPGITGYQQIKNRGGTSLGERVKYDLVYLKHQSLLLDFYILFKTPLVVLKGTGITH